MAFVKASDLVSSPSSDPTILLQSVKNSYSNSFIDNQIYYVSKTATFEHAEPVVFFPRV